MIYDRDELNEIALYAGYAADAIRQTQELMRKYAGYLGSNRGQFLRDAADALSAVVHDEIDPALHMAAAELELSAPSHIASDRADYHARLGVQAGA